MSKMDRNRELLKSLLDDWNREFDEMEASIGNSDGDTNFGFDEVITELRRRHYKNKSGRYKKDRERPL